MRAQGEKKEDMKAPAAYGGKKIFPNLKQIALARHKIFGTVKIMRNPKNNSNRRNGTKFLKSYLGNMIGLSSNLRKLYFTQLRHMQGKDNGPQLLYFNIAHMSNKNLIL